MQVFLYRTKQAHVITYMWRNSVQPIITVTDIKDCGWLPNGEIFWMVEAFPAKIEKTLQEVDNDNKDCALEGDVEDDDGDDF